MLVRAYRSGLRAFTTLRSALFLWGLAIPWFLSRGMVGRRFSVLFAHECAMVFDERRLYKIALSDVSTIRLEYTNYRMAIEQWPQLRAVLPEIGFREATFLRYVTMARFRPLGPNESIPHASALYRVMRTCGARGSKPMEEFRELLDGVEVIGGLYGAGIAGLIRGHVETYLAANDYHVGFAHGDFHSRNIMLDNHDTPRMIDLDCVRLAGIQELDAIYFVLEWEWSKSGTLWCQTLARFLKGQLAPDCSTLLETFGVKPAFLLCVTYLADRLGQEAKMFGLRYTRTLLDPAIEAIGSAERELAGA